MRRQPYILSALFVIAGLAHFAFTNVYASIVPNYLPAHRELVWISGVAEIAGGFGLLYRRTRRAAAWGLIALLIAVFPANLWMAQHADQWPRISAWLLWARLPLQLPLIGWAARYARR